MKSNDWKDRLGIMYSTNPDFQYNTGDEEEEETLPKEKQLLRIALDKRNRGGKAVTLVTGFRGTSKTIIDKDLEAVDYFCISTVAYAAYLISTVPQNPLDQTLRFSLSFDMDGIKNLFR